MRVLVDLIILFYVTFLEDKRLVYYDNLSYI